MKKELDELTEKTLRLTYIWSRLGATLQKYQIGKGHNGIHGL